MKTATKKASQNGHAQTLADLSPEELKAMADTEQAIVNAHRQRLELLQEIDSHQRQMIAHQANLQALQVEIAKREAKSADSAV